jgi:hypothetical protein
MPFYGPIEKIDPEHLEPEAVDYDQERIGAATDESLRKILEHNMSEEKEHAATPVEWLRRNDPVQDEFFRKHD